MFIFLRLEDTIFQLSHAKNIDDKIARGAGLTQQLHDSMSYARKCLWLLGRHMPQMCLSNVLFLYFTVPYYGWPTWINRLYG